MSSTDSAIARKVDDILRNQWTIYFGFSGRHAPDLVDDMLRIMHLPRDHRCAYVLWAAFYASGAAVGWRCHPIDLEGRGCL